MWKKILPHEAVNNTSRHPREFQCEITNKHLGNSGKNHIIKNYGLMTCLEKSS